MTTLAPMLFTKSVRPKIDFVGKFYYSANYFNYYFYCFTFFRSKASLIASTGGKVGRSHFLVVFSLVLVGRIRKINKNYAKTLYEVLKRCGSEWHAQLVKEMHSFKFPFLPGSPQNIMEKNKSPMG